MSTNQLADSRSRFLAAVDSAKMGDNAGVQVYLREIAERHGREVAVQCGREVRGAMSWNIEAVRLQWQS